jgi:hypothetical protein
MQNLGAYLVGAAFWLFLAASAVAGIVADYKRRRIGVEVVRAAIEKGQSLDPALIEKLTAAPQEQRSRVEAVDLRLAAVITIASGIGLCPAAWLVSRVLPIAFYPMLGLGVLAIFVGIGLEIGAGVLARAAGRT